MQFLRLRARPRSCRRLFALFGRSRPPRARGVGTRRHRGLRPRRAAARPRRIFLPRSSPRHQACHSRNACACVLADGNRLRCDENRNALRDYLQMMKDEGLGSIPGTAAEILDDRVRKELSPNKLPVARWVEIITAAHELGIPTTSTMMYGHVEGPADWVRHILLLRSIQKRTGGFTEFVPLGFIHENTRLYRHGGARPGAKREEHLRVHALARVLLHGAIKNLQVSWVKLGFETSLACLQAGANDFSGTLMEENISKAAGATFGEYVSPEEFRAKIRTIGRVPAERTTTYKIRRVFAHPEDDPRTIPARLPMARPESHAPYTEGAY